MPNHDEIINPFIKIHNLNVTWIDLAYDFVYMYEVMPKQDCYSKNVEKTFHVHNFSGCIMRMAWCYPPS